VPRSLPISYLVFCCAILSQVTVAQDVVPITKERNHQLTISNEYVRVFKVEVPPKTETLYHQHDYDYVYVVIGDADVSSTHLNEKPVSAKLRDGEVGFAKGGFAHKAFNNADEPFDNVTVELLKGAGKVLCGTKETRPCGGKSKNTGAALLLDTEKVSVRSIEVRRTRALRLPSSALDPQSSCRPGTWMSKRASPARFRMGSFCWESQDGSRQERLAL